MSQAPTAVPQFKAESPGLAIVLGIIMIILGLLAMMAPLLTGIAISILAGSFLVVAGIAKCIYAFKAHSWGRGILGFITGLVAIAAGFIMLFRPLLGLISLTWLLAIYFIVHGIIEIAWGFRIKPRRNWGWVIANGIISLLLGLLIWLQWPFSGVWAIGLLVGINILFNGVTMLVAGPAEQGITSPAGGGVA